MTIVTIIGYDGSGKTTQAKILVRRLKEEGYKAIYVRPVFILLSFINQSKNKYFTAISPRLASTSRKGNLNEKRGLFSIKKVFMGLLAYPYALLTYLFMSLYLKRNKIVVCDRYFYQFFFDVFRNSSENIIRFFPKADFTFFLDADLDILYSRIKGSLDATFEKDYCLEAISLFRKLSKVYGFSRIDANLGRKRINDIIFRRLKRMVEYFYE